MIIILKMTVSSWTCPESISVIASVSAAISNFVIPSESLDVEGSCVHFLIEISQSLVLIRNDKE